MVRLLSSCLSLQGVEIVMALITHAPDSDATVRESISSGIYDVGTVELTFIAPQILQEGGSLS